MTIHKSIVGTEFKILVEIEPIDDAHMEDMEFTCLFYTNFDNPLTVKKTDMIKVNADGYIALVDTEGMKPGTLRNRITVDIPDKDFDDQYRREIADVETGVKIYR